LREDIIWKDEYITRKDSHVRAQDGVRLTN